MLATVFTSHGGYGSPQAFVNGPTPAMWVGTAVLATGALTALVLPFSTKAIAPVSGRDSNATGRPDNRASPP